MERIVMNCPYHEEETPSCLVRDNEYYCLGCGTSGKVKGDILMESAIKHHLDKLKEIYG